MVLWGLQFGPKMTLGQQPVSLLTTRLGTCPFLPVELSAQLLHLNAVPGVLMTEILGLHYTGPAFFAG